MAEEMGSGTEVTRAYQDAIQAQLGERVTNLGRRQTDLESEMRSGFKQMETAVSSLANEMRTSVASLSTNIAERNRPQWQAIGVTLTFCAMIGGLVYWPINASTIRLESAIATIADKMVTQKEMEWRTQRGSEDRARTEMSVKDIRESQVPRLELDRVFESYNQQFRDQQRQIDEVKTAQGSVYGTRDILLDLRERIDRMERQRLAASQSGG